VNDLVQSYSFQQIHMIEKNLNPHLIFPCCYPQKRSITQVFGRYINLHATLVRLYVRLFVRLVRYIRSVGHKSVNSWRTHSSFHPWKLVFLLFHVKNVCCLKWWRFVKLYNRILNAPLSPSFTVSLATPAFDLNVCIDSILYKKNLTIWRYPFLLTIQHIFIFIIFFISLPLFREIHHFRDYLICSIYSFGGIPV